jgi:putative ABC transport system permease protein
MEIRPILSALMKNRTGALLIAAQVALTLAILCNALFVVNERVARAARPSGADEQNVFAMSFSGFRDNPDIAGQQRRDLDALRALPGVVAAAWVNQVPLAQSGWQTSLTADPSNHEGALSAANYFGPGGLVDALGLTLIEGRDFTEADVVEVDPRIAQIRPDVVLITRQLGQRLFPEANSYVGKTVHLGTGGDDPAMRVIGVIDRLITPFAQNHDDANSSFVLPIRYITQSALYVVRTEPGERARVMGDAASALTALSNDRVLLWTRTMGEIRDRRYANDRQLSGMLLAVTGGLLLVTASGIVGMASLWVAQRRRQIGTRRALGATRGDILRYFITENVMVTTLGVASGALLAIGLNLYLTEQIAMARLPLDYVAYGVLGLLLLGVLAVLGPAARAAAVPPAVATRGA